MVIVLATVGVAFGAFCIWLTVRVVNRERWAKWTAVGLAVSLPAAYILSTGPLIWLVERDLLSDSTFGEVERLYTPLVWLAEEGPAPLSTGLRWYGDLWRKERDVYMSPPVIRSIDIQSD